LNVKQYLPKTDEKKLRLSKGNKEKKKSYMTSRRKGKKDNRGGIEMRKK